ncbi:efflux RND transporter permease subunit [Periweissella fabalis]|uniref:RND family transporter n=1 Tax=Periweissella fabalis TaxID=1070421 RepID=A0A7X6N173_9LACO|nr:MMPL family transporter [Periweissella fabalis]MCM0599618.1 RND family transporter [Periweissella fabalis]NKZ23923.1 RND family transporter [Periweissella fabalis]
MSTALLRDLILENGHVNKNIATLLPKDGRHLLLLVTIDKADMDTDVKLVHDLKTTINNHPIKGVNIRVAGQPAILGNISGEVMTTMAIMLSLAVIMMIIILALVFHVRRRLLSLLFVLIGLVWSFGIMGWLNISLTLATMATLPILIGLGTDFGVQFQNRYEEEYRKHANVMTAIQQAVITMGPGIGSALVVMIFTFLTMFLSKAPLMQQFGLTLAIGVFAVYIVEFLLMFATLRLLDRNNHPIKQVHQNNFIGNLLGKYARFVIKHAKLIAVFGIIIGLAGFTVEHKVPIETDLMNMIPKNMPALKDTKYLQKQVGSTNYLTYLVEAPNVTKKPILIATDKLAHKIDSKYDNVVDYTTITSAYTQMFGSLANASQQQINQNISTLPSALREQMLSNNKQYAMIQFKINERLSSDEQNKLMKQINHDVKQATIGHDYQIVPAGPQVLMLVGLDNIASNRMLMMIAGIMAIIILLTLLYRRLSHALLPAFPIVIVLGISPLTLYLLGQSYNPLTLGLSALVLGIGTEFTILIIERYREEVMNGHTVQEAVVQSVQSVGQAITVSGLTVVGGFFAIIFVSFPVLSSFGLITVLDTAFSLIAALTLLPAIIVLTQGKIDNRLRQKGVMSKAKP